LPQITLVLVDEVHLLNEAGRGSALEAGCICRLKAIAALPEMAKVGTLCCSCSCKQLWFGRLCFSHSCALHCTLRFSCSCKQLHAAKVQ
jgi:hypothetical protein